LAESFAQRGLDVVLADVEADPLRQATSAIEALGVATLAVRTDVRVATDLEALADATLERFGRVDLVCNNAGVSSMPTPSWELSASDWEWVLSVNLNGVINGIRAFVPHLVAQNAGHVVNTASMAGISAAPWLGPYLASKHAVVALSEGLALELGQVAPDVGVTVVCPGLVATNIVGSDRNRPDDLPASAHEIGENEVMDLIGWSSTISGPEMTAAEAAVIVVAAVEANVLHVAPNGSIKGVHARVDRLLADLTPAR
jgi:NADP-dependent 3-hydroxy acid dehydrogenase YdfG